MFNPLVSICIPAYKEPDLLVRTLDSVVKQDYKNIEVIISDDSPDDSVKIAIEPYKGILKLNYIQHSPALKSPANWNAALDKGRGELKMLMHHDDWLHLPESISIFVDEFRKDPNVDGVFSQNTAIDANGKVKVLQMIPSILTTMHSQPNHLVRFNVIGPPSNLMVKNTVATRYDTRFIWLVDVDYLTRLLKAGYKLKYIERHLVSIGLHEAQTTAYCMANQDIIVKENIWFADKIEKAAFNDILVFDYYWRLLRNQHIRDEKQLINAGVDKEKIPAVIKHMLSLQQKFSPGILKQGALSKSLMFLNYSAWMIKNKRS